jgi:hypothetical protein
VSCHLDYGRLAKFKFDDWGTLTRPANLFTGVYRGGRRPIDLYWRLHSGINGSGMNRFADVLIADKSANNSVLTEDRLWDLVNFVQALPYPQMRKGLPVPIR